MLDIKFIRQNPQLIKDAARKKGVSVNVDKLLDLDENAGVFLRNLKKSGLYKTLYPKKAQRHQPSWNRLEN